MKKYIFILLFIIFASFINAGELCIVYSNKSGSGSTFLDSPYDIDLSKLETSFDPNLDSFVFVHGFNTSPSGVKNTYEKSYNMLKSQKNFNYIGFYWPSDVLPNFKKGIDNANKAGSYLVFVLGEISRWYGSRNRNIHLMTHSLGGRVLLSTLKDNSSRYVKWGKCFSTAPAVNDNVYHTSFVNTNKTPDKTYVFYSANDGVLKYWYYLYYWLFEAAPAPNSRSFQAWQNFSVQEKFQYLKSLDERNQRGEALTDDFDKSLLSGLERTEREAMGLCGADLGNPVTINKVVNVNMKDFIDGHSDYWVSQEIIKRIINALN